MNICSQKTAEIVANTAGAAEVFRRNGINYHLHGELRLNEAAHRNGVDVDTLVSELAELDLETITLPTSTRGLIDLISRRYDKAHQVDLVDVIRMARAETRRSPDNPLPSQLAHLLRLIADQLVEHQQKEAQGLFRAMLRPSPEDLRFPILRAMAEHEEVTELLDTLTLLTNNFTPPLNAGPNLADLYRRCAHVDADIRFHIHLEDNVLFPRFASHRQA